jgi:hypothetical protein
MALAVSAGSARVFWPLDLLMEDMMRVALRVFALTVICFLASWPRPASAQPAPPSDQQQPAFTPGELVTAGQLFFGTISQGLATVIEKAAEEARFEQTPAAILRLDEGGYIRFANANARRLWSTDLTGTEFTTLFPTSIRAEIRSHVLEVMTTEQTRRVRVTKGFGFSAGGQEFPCKLRLSLLPYFAPGGRRVGVLALLQERILEALQLVLNEQAAGNPVSSNGDDDWRTDLCAVLDLLRQIVPHDRAVLAVLSEDRAWARPLLVHPTPEPRWARVWTRPPERERLVRGPFAMDGPEHVVGGLYCNADPLEPAHFADEMVSHAVVPLPNAEPAWLLTLSSREPGFFKQDDDARGQRAATR